MCRTLHIGIAAVYGTQRVCAHIPDSGTVGGDGVLMPGSCATNEAAGWQAARQGKSR